MADEDDRSSLALEAPEGVEAFLLEARVADCENLVDEIDVGVSLDRRGEPEPHLHPGGVVLELQVDELLELGELDDRGEALAEPRRARGRASDGVDDDVVERRKLGLKPTPSSMNGETRPDDRRRAHGSGW